MKKMITRTLIVLVALVAIVALAFQLSPWPGIWVIRASFNSNAHKVAQNLEAKAPAGIKVTSGIQYAAGSLVEAGKDTTFDIVRTEKQQEEKLPVLIWTHGGAWVSGDSGQVNPYLKYLVPDGYAAVSMNYSLAPEKQYPTQVEQLNTALDFLKKHQEEYKLDMSKVVLAGDSAGAQLSSQIAALTTNPEFAKASNITPSLEPSALKGLVLNCGIYDMPKMLGTKTGSWIVDWGFNQVAWAQTGIKNVTSTEANFQQMSTIQHVTAQYPPVLISGGNGDELTVGQSKPFAEKLTGLGVKVTPVFFDKADPKLPHEYQFKLGEFKEADTMLQETRNWVKEHLK